MSRVEEDKIVTKKVCKGHNCDICGKKIEFNSKLFRNINTIKWEHPSGGWGENTEYECIVICNSIDCLNKALKKVYYGAKVNLNSDFFYQLHKGD